MKNIFVMLTSCVMLMTFGAVAFGETINCTPITTIPATISTQGVYCLKGNLSTAMTAGMAIHVTANNVTIDLNGWKIGGQAAGMGTDVIGIYGGGSNLTVKNGSIRGFRIGIWFLGDGTRIENLLIENSTKFGIQFSGNESIVRRNRIIATGGATTGTAEDAIGIFAGGTNHLIEDNFISNLATAGDGYEYGIAAVGGNFTMNGNVINDESRPSGAGSSYGIYTDYSGSIVNTENSIANFDYGIHYTSSAAGTYAQNVVVHCDTPYYGGTNGSDND